MTATLAMAAAHLDLTPGIHPGGWVRWVGGAPQDVSGPLLTLSGRAWIPPGSAVLVTDRASGTYPGWCEITYPEGWREAWNTIVAAQKDAEAGRPATREEIPGLPEDWETEASGCGHALGAFPPCNEYGVPVGTQWDGTGFWRIGADGPVYHQRDGLSPWTPR